MDLPGRREGLQDLIVSNIDGAGAAILGARVRFRQHFVRRKDARPRVAKALLQDVLDN